MRQKQDILEELHRNKAKAPAWDTTASLHERITIEVLIDIRDALITDAKDAMNALIELRKTH